MVSLESGNDIAVIGMGCRFSGDAKSPSEFYEMLLQKRSGWKEVPKDRFNIESFWHPSYDRHGTIVCKGGHFLEEDVGLFDAPFFSMTQGEANAMDPQQRMLLEITYEALENAGLPLQKVVGSDTACFVGGFSREYDDINRSELAKTLLYTTTGSGLTMMSNRLSWFYDLHGPSISVDTACSSSLVALHLACQTIKGSTSQSRQAIVGGVNLVLVPDQMASMNPLHFLSPDSQCFSFDDRANGYTRGEGIGILVLKHIDDAIRDGDCIRAVIRGTAVNSDGKTPGITLPSATAQASLIQKTYREAGLDPANTGYFEAHGTGTGAGDPIEVSAIASCFVRKSKDADAPLYIGSVKPNIGHLEAGAGLAGLIKTIFTLEAGVIPPNINFVTPNPKLRLEDQNFIIPTEPTPWPTEGLRRASVNSFGYGGTNGHCILDDAYHYLDERGLIGRTHTIIHSPSISKGVANGCAPDMINGHANGLTNGATNSLTNGHAEGLVDEDTKKVTNGHASDLVNGDINGLASGHANGSTYEHGSGLSNEDPGVLAPLKSQNLLFTLSAPEQNAVSRLGRNLASYVEKKSCHEGNHSILEQMAFTLNNRRTDFLWRSVVVGTEPADIQRHFKDLEKPIRAGKSPSNLFCFTGQGAQWYAMGRELLTHEIFRNSVLKADRYLESIQTGASWSVLRELMMSKESSRINQPNFSQPLCTILQIALVDLLSHWNVKPTAVVGHSSGEIAAAYAIGALSATDCWKIAFHRGRLAADLKTIAPHINGGMMAVGLGETDVHPFITAVKNSKDEVLSVVCINSPSSVTVAGDVSLLNKLEKLLKGNAVFCRMLAVENAYHSVHMKLLSDNYYKSIEDITPMSTIESSSDAIRMVSSVTGNLVQPGELGPAYWVSNMVSPVQFVSAISQAVTAPKAKGRGKALQIDTVVEVGPHAALQGPIKQIMIHIEKQEKISYLSALRRGSPADLTALQLAGALWNKGAKVRLDLVNTTNATSPLFAPLSDMPKYPWNHETRYWHECAPSKTHRFRDGPRTDLLGYPVKEFSILEPKWKNVIYSAELPWISDHRVRGNDVFPAAGMMCAALEGIRQIADKSRPVDSYELRDIIISRALIIPPSDPGIDVFTSFKKRNAATASEDVGPWYEFSFTSLEVPEAESLNYVEHARGLVAINYQSQSLSRFTDMNEKSAEAVQTREEYEMIKRTSKIAMSQSSHLADTTAMGFDYGPTFQGLTSAKIAKNQASFTIEITDTAAVMPAQFEYEHLLHPSTLDAAIQSMYPALRTSIDKIDQSVVPTGLGSLHVSAQMPKGAGTQLVGFSKARKLGYQQNAADIMISDPSWSETMLELRELSVTGLGDSNNKVIDDDQAVAIHKTCSETRWRLDVDLLDKTKDHSQLLYGQGVETPESLDHWGYIATKVTAIFIKRFLVFLSFDDEHALSSLHLKKLLSWMRDRYTEAQSGHRDYQNGVKWHEMTVEEEEQAISEYTAKYPDDGLLVTSIGRNLSAIFDGSEDPLQIMLKDDMLTNIYARGVPFHSGLDMFKSWFSLQGHKHPDMKVLEVGAGTGSVTLPILQALGGHDGGTPCFESYCFTDISAGWFEKAQELLKPWQGRIDYRMLNIEEDVLGQGFELETFDVIAASNVLHATKRMDLTLSNCFKLLRPGGKIVIGELTWSQDCIGLVFGTLPGWWLSEDERSGGPLMTHAEWDQRLRSAGFTGLDQLVAAKDSLGNAKLSMMVSSKPLRPKTTLERVVIICPSQSSRLGTEITSHLQKVFSTEKMEFVDLEAASVRAKAGDFLKPGLSVVSLLESDDHVFALCSQKVFEAIRNVILNSTKLLWVTCHNTKDGLRSPESCAISGLFRTAKSENGRLFLQELHLRKRFPSEAVEAAKIIGRVVKSTWSAAESAEYEDEIVEANDMLTIPRLFDEEHMNRTLQNLGATPQPEPQELSSISWPLTLGIGKPGLLDTLHFIDDDKVLQSLAPDEVLIDVKAAAVNQDDLSVALGQKTGLSLGLEGAGYVKQSGSSVASIGIGDIVAFVSPGAIATCVRIKRDLVHILPKSMTLEDGAAIPVAFMTAYQSLIEIAHLAKGERVLIHSTAGELGQAMIQLAQHIGAEIFVTVATTESFQLMQACGVQKDHILDSRDLSFAKAISRLTNSHGVDVVANTLSGEALMQNLTCISPFGRFIELGWTDISANTLLEMKHFSGNVTFSSVNIEEICRIAPEKAGALLTKVFNLFHLGVLKVVHPVTVFDYSDMRAAFRTLQNPQHIGKVVLKQSTTSIIPALPHDAHPLVLRPDATYVLVGGLGGLGRGLAIYLAEHGAKYLAFFSRTANIPTAAQKVLQELAERKVTTKVYACDITEAPTLKKTVADLAAEMPPIKGIIQGAMVLRDGLFETMSYENWTSATTPKIQGSWNLHTHMPSDLDFFVILSSLAGILGNRGQSNYCAGNTYQDALGYYRRSLGLPGQVVDLGAISGLGWFEENKEELKFAETMKNLLIGPDEFFAIIKSAITGYSHGENRVPMQIVTGVGSGGLNKANETAGSQTEYYWLNEAPRMSYLRQLDLHNTLQTEAAGGIGELKASLTGANTLTEATELIQGVLISKFAKSMMIQIEEIDVSRPVSSYGVDSLVAAEVRNWCFKELKADISIFELLSGVTITGLAELIAGKSALVRVGEGQ